MRIIGRTYNYNNKVILKITEEPEIRVQFQEFLNKKASNWIESSKIIDKSTHM